MADKADLAVIGSGPGGYVAAIRASQLGLKTVVVEKAELGGICLNWGCIPTKALLHSATLYNQIKHAGEFGVQVQEAAVDLAKMVKHSRATAQRLSKGIEFLFRKNNVSVIRGHAALAAQGRITVTTTEGKKELLEADDILIAAGARPRTLPGVEFDGQQIITSREAMVPQQLPESMIIIGAGAIGVEFAYFYATLGVRITLVEMLPQILPIEDAEVAEVVAKAFKKLGVTILTGTRVLHARKIDNGVQVKINNQNGEQTLQASQTLVAVGVTGNVENLGLEDLGVKTEKGFIPVDRRSFQTNVAHIYAIGDVIGAPWLAHVASAEGITAVEHLAGKTPAAINYDHIPGCTYCQPQVASFGLTEQKAKDKGLDVKIGRFPFRANGKSLAMGESEGFVKLIFDARYGELLGGHIVGAEATELLAELGVAKTLETTAEEIIQTIHAHPTISESIKEAAEDAFGQAIHI
ncbi:dihydrolipoyl dehydrogenase [bacterium]|nr:dihydrolipoyl dehydrogenase [bacterium]